MSLLDLIQPEQQQQPILDESQASTPTKKTRAKSTKKASKQEALVDNPSNNPYLIDMDKYLQSHPITMISPRPEIYSFEAVSAIPGMEWIANTSITPYAPNTPDVAQQKEALNIFLDSLINESVTISKDILPDYFIHTQPKPLIAYDLETSGLNTTIRYYDGKLAPQVKIVGVSLATSSMKSYYLPVNHNCLDGALNWSEEAIIPFLSKLFATFITISHNGQFDREVSAINGVVIDQDNRYIDTLIIAHLFDANTKAIGLKILSDTLIHRPQIETSELFPDSMSFGFNRLSLQDAFVYAGLDTLNTYALFEFFASHPTNNVFKQQPIPLTIDLKMCDVVRSMCRVGMPVNMTLTVKMALDLIVRQKMLLEEIDKFVGRKVDIRSPQQLSALLFDEYKIPTDGVPKGKSGFYSTGEDILDALYEKYPNYTILKYVVMLRKLGNSLVKYCVKLINNSFCCEMMPYLHSQIKYSLTTIPTGRLSSSSSGNRDMVYTKTSEKTGRVSYKYETGECSCGLNSQGLSSVGYGEYEAMECTELPPEANIAAALDPANCIDELIRFCSEG